jgi:G6PDH family F420-dependent oxidoreductase
VAVPSGTFIAATGWLGNLTGWPAGLKGSAAARQSVHAARGSEVLKLGYKLMSEEHGPAELVANAHHAEQAGFDFAAISDHFFPWVEEQGHSPLAWSILGAIANATTRLGLMTAVTCPTMRYHPAIVAQGAATLALLSNNRFSLGLGSGERLNEHIVGMGWPGIAERHERFGEAVDIIRGLLAGNLHNYRGNYLKLENARLYDRPQASPPIVIAAAGPKAARFAAEKGDGLMATEAQPQLIQAYRGAGGAGPRYAEVPMCCARREDEARQTAHRYFRWAATGWPVQAELPDTKAFAAASQHIPVEVIADKITCGPSPERHLEAIGKFVDAGFDHVILVQIGPDQEFFFDFFANELAPKLRQRLAA